jgi:hypothetical protein
LTAVQARDRNCFNFYQRFDSSFQNMLQPRP